MNMIEKAKAHPVISMLLGAMAVAVSSGTAVSTYYTQRESIESSVAAKVVNEIKPDVDALRAEIKAIREFAQSENRTRTQQELAFGYLDSEENWPLYNYPSRGITSGKMKSYSLSSSSARSSPGSFKNQR